MWAVPRQQVNQWIPCAIQCRIPSEYHSILFVSRCLCDPGYKIHSIMGVGLYPRSHELQFYYHLVVIETTLKIPPEMHSWRQKSVSINRSSAWVCLGRCVSRTRWKWKNGKIELNRKRKPIFSDKQFMDKVTEFSTQISQYLSQSLRWKKWTPNCILMNQWINKVVGVLHGIYIEWI